MIRYQPPAYSPLTVQALVGGALGGPSTPDLATTLKHRYGSQAVTLWDSGTSALTSALSLGKKPPVVVALPAYGCYDLATAALGAGADVLLYDLDPETLAPEPGSFARVLEREPSAVVVAYLYGVPFDTSVYARQASAAGVILVEDAAQGFGAAVDERSCGALGSIGVLSFGRGKGVTGGGGGAVLLNGAGLNAADPPPGGGGWSGWGKAWVQWTLACPSWYWLPASLPFLQLGETIYHDPHTARGMPLIHQRVLLRLLVAADEEADVRKRHALRLAEIVEANPSVQPVRVSAGTPGYLRYPVLANGPRLRSPRAKRLGIIPGYPITLDRLPALASRVRNAGDLFPGAERLAAELVTLPTHSLLRERDLDLIASLIA